MQGAFTYGTKLRSIQNLVIQEVNHFQVSNIWRGYIWLPQKHDLSLILFKLGKDTLCCPTLQPNSGCITSFLLLLP